jgi:hypothetical protein
MRYLGTHFSLTIGGMRLRVRIDLDDADDEKGETAPNPANRENGTSSDRRVPHHLRSRGT